MKKKSVVALLLSTIAVAPALAADAGTTYVNLDYSAFNLGSPSVFGILGGQAFANPGAFRIGAGYNFTPNVAVEAGYSIIGDSTLNSSAVIGGLSATGSETLKASSFQVAAVGTMPINAQFDVFGKLGLASNKADYSCSGSVAGIAITCTPASASKTSVMFGVGAKYNIDKNWGVRVQYENYGKVDFTTGGTAQSFKFSALSVGGVYNF